MEQTGPRAGWGHTQQERESDVFRRLIALSLVSGALVLVSAGAAWAPRVHLLPGYTGDCTAQVEGEDVAGTFQGQASVDHYEAKADAVVATILVNGSCTVPGEVFSIADAISSTVVSVAAASCSELRLQLGDAPVKDVIVDLSEDEIVLSAEKRDRGIFCRIAKARGMQSPAKLAADLNTLITR